MDKKDKSNNIQTYRPLDEALRSFTTASKSNLTDLANVATEVKTLLSTNPTRSEKREIKSQIASRLSMTFHADKSYSLSRLLAFHTSYHKIQSSGARLHNLYYNDFHNAINIVLGPLTKSTQILSVMNDFNGLDKKTSRSAWLSEHRPTPKPTKTANTSNTSNTSKTDKIDKVVTYIHNKQFTPAELQTLIQRLSSPSTENSVINKGIKGETVKDVVQEVTESQAAFNAEQNKIYKTIEQNPEPKTEPKTESKTGV